MNRKKQVLRNLVILFVVILFFMRLFALHLSPLSVLENAERSLHYGPSEVVHVEEHPGGKYILGRYDKWFSFYRIDRVYFFLWRLGGINIGNQIDLSESISYSGGATQSSQEIYGIINDNRIKKVEVLLTDGTVLSQAEFYDSMFLFTLQEPYEDKWKYKDLRAYDSENNLIYEEELY
ncbi:hypothetical protein [Dethiobacter alkaliphilus]|uniref:hypothetical protein n=1 Tax=Dethiobacter alkaliphilus TaxID=427926 RepID=UPI0022277F68|nr:hypothetical protein [Dethiobacter alkaliphilus]MCW3488933.1 hypothetical protein [Dethiobacter alkaliphilus]